MIRHDGIDGAILQPFNQRFSVFVRAQRRRHFESRFIVLQPFVGEIEVLRGDFCRAVHTLRLGLADKIDGLAARYMRDVDMTAGQLRKEQVASDCDIFPCRRTSGDAHRIGDLAFIHEAVSAHRHIFRMVDDHLAELICVLHGAAHEIGTFYIVSVIRESDSAIRCHIPHFRELLAFEILGDRADHGNLHDTSLSYAGLHITQNRRIVACVPV